jgi:hypothetical protein
MGYLALGGPRVPSDLHIPEYFSSPTLSQASNSPPPSTASGNERVFSRSFSASDHKRHSAMRHPRGESEEDESSLHFRFNDSPSRSQPHSSPPPQRRQNHLSLPSSSASLPSSYSSPLPLPYEDPDVSPSPTYRRAYRIEHSRNDDDPLTGEEVVKLMQDLEKVTPLPPWLRPLTVSADRCLSENPQRV